MNLAIIYGSESLLLKSFIDNYKGLILRIYNNRKPEKKNNCFDIKFDDSFETGFSSYMINRLNEINKIIFLGVAFATDKKLFWAEDNSTINSNINTNITNYVHLTKIVLIYMMRKKSGKFIYLSSFRSKISTRGTALYSSSKAFGEMFYKQIGQEYGAFNITSHILRMGYFDGRILDTLGKEAQEKIKKRISVGRLGNSFDIENSINFCINNDYLNSGVIEINGGIDFG